MSNKEIETRALDSQAIALGAFQLALGTENQHLPTLGPCLTGSGFDSPALVQWQLIT